MVQKRIAWHFYRACRYRAGDQRFDGGDYLQIIRQIFVCGGESIQELQKMWFYHHRYLQSLELIRLTAQIDSPHSNCGSFVLLFYLIS